MIEFNEEKHEYRKDGRVIPGVTTVLNDVGLANYDYVDAETMEAAGKFGDAVHKVTQFYDKGTLDNKTVHKGLKPCLKQWKKFLKDFDVKIIEIERRVFYKRYFYCGTLDRILIMRAIDDQECILDLKTGSKMKSHALQNSAYKRAIQEEGRKLSKTTYTLYLKDDGYKLEHHKDKNDINFFLSALQIYNFKRRK